MGGVSLQIINLQTDLNYLDSVNIFKIFSVLTWPYPSTHPTTHPPTIHPLMGGEFFTDFKSSNGIEISWLVQVLSNFDRFQGSLLGVADGGWGSVWVCGGCPMYTCIHMHVKHVVNIINMDASMLAAICNFYTCIHVHGCMCMHVYMCGNTPHAPDTPHPPAASPEPQGAQNTKIQ